MQIAENGMIGLVRLGECPWDLILADLWLPPPDGPGLYRELERTGLPSVSEPATPDEVQRGPRALRG